VGRALSLLSRFQRLRGLTCPAAPTGVSHLQQKSTVRENDNVYENSLKYYHHLLYVS
jgi:hypothetical protein